MAKIITKFKNLGPSSRQMKVALFAVLFVLAAAILLVNRGVNYAYYQYTYVLQIPLNADENYILGFAGNAHVSGVDRSNYQVRYQGISNGDFQEIVKKVTADFPDQVVTSHTSVEFLPTNLGFKLAYGAAVALLIAWIGAYWTVTRKLEKPARRQANKLSLALMFSWVGVGVVNLGLLSLLSLFYELKEVTFVIWGIAIIVMYALTSLSWYQLSIRHDAENLAASYRHHFSGYAGPILLAVTVISLSMLGGLGLPLLPEIGLLLLYMLFMSYAMVELPTLLVNISFQRPTFKKSPAVSTDIESPASMRNEKKGKNKSAGRRKHKGRRL